jgi:hypothetical protein
VNCEICRINVDFFFLLVKIVNLDFVLARFNNDRRFFFIL